MDTFKILYTVLGGLGLFFYGMRSLSDSLQALAGDLIKRIINMLTTNRVLAVIVGLLVTMLVQSSSVTSVMVVGFVNAGLMKLTQAIGVIFGSNIGTTITGWIISIKIGKYGLLLVGLGIFPYLFGKSNEFRQTGRMFFGMGLIFIGLETMSDAFKPLRDNSSFLNMVSYFSGQDYGSYLACIFTGCLLTMIIQSSSAMLGITMALATTGVIAYPTAVALVLGENIGTTITALLASVGANVNAKRAARAHAIFNVLGVSLLFFFLPYFMDFIEWLIPKPADFLNEAGERPYVAPHIAAAHTAFNVSATLLFLPFLNQLSALVTWLTPDRKQGKDAHHLILFGKTSEILPATAIVQATEEIKKFRDILARMYRLTRDLLQGEVTNPQILAKVRDYERITDNIQKEVTVFVCLVMEKSLSHEQSLQAQGLVRIADEFESVADYLERMANYKARFNESTIFSGENKEEFFNFADEIWKFFELCTVGLTDLESHDLQLCERKSESLRIWADAIRDKHIHRVSAGEFTALSALTFSDMVVALRKIRAHALTVAQAISRMEDL